MKIAGETLAFTRAKRERAGFLGKLGLLVAVSAGIAASLFAQDNLEPPIVTGGAGSTPGLPSSFGETSPGQASVSSYATHNWQTQDGLPHNSVQALAMTRDGYLWLGTERGLARFDGVRFTSFDTGPLKDLSTASITALTSSKDGVLWIGTRDHGLFRWHEGKLDPLFLLYTNVTVRTFFMASDETLWVGTEWGLAGFRRSQLESWLGMDDVRSISEDAEGNLLLATGGGLRKVKERQAIRVETNGPSIRAVTFARNGETWVGDNFSVVHIAGGEATQITRQDGLASGVVNTIYEDRHERIWIGTSSGLNYLTDNGAVYEVKHEGGSLDWVYAIYEDREENLWVGARDGLYRLNTKLFTTFTKEHGLVNHNVSSVREDRSRIWIGTWGGGLHYLENGIISRYPIRSQYFNNLVLGLFVDRTGSLWLGTDFEGGMYRRDRDDKVFRYWKEHGSSNLNDPAVRTILLDSQKGRIWVGSKDALNVALRGKQFWRYSTENDLPNSQINVIMEDTRGDVWVGTDGGLVFFKDEEIRVYTTTNGLSHNAVTALYEDRDNTLWIGTAGGGLNRLKNDKFSAYTMREGLFSDEIFEIVEDNFNRIWMTCRSGIFWVAKGDIDTLDAGKHPTLSCVSYGKDDGLNSVNCNNLAKPSACKSSDGRLWFATVKGLSVVDPATISRTAKEPPPVVIEKILWNRKSFAADGAVELPAGRGELEFQFTALSLTSPERNRFKYKLEGVDTDWNDAGTRRFAHYNNIYPGKYVFRVQACDGSGVWNLLGANITFTLLPQFWQTWWFKALPLLALTLVLAGFYRVRVSRIREMERLRVRIAADLHDEIGSSIGSISLLTQKIQKEGPLADEQKADLTAIGRISTQAANSIREIVWFINPQYDTMQDLLARMKDAAGTMLAGLKLRLTFPQEDMIQKVSPEFRRNVFLMFKEILGNIIKHSRATEVELVVVEQKGVWLLLVRDNGKGFNPDSAHGGNGLKNLRHRAERLNGKLEVRSQPGGGTTIIFSTTKF